MKSWLQENHIEMCSIHNEERLLKELLGTKKKQNLEIYDFSIKNVYIDKLDDTVNRYHIYILQYIAQSK